MPKLKLETTIQKAASDFALTIVDAVKGATLEELIALQGERPKRRGRKPGPKPKAKKKPGRKPGRPKKAKPGPKPKAKSAAAKKVAAKKAAANKKRSINYPKCAYPGCKNNRYARGKGFCGDHFKKFKAGKIKAADSYQKK